MVPAHAFFGQGKLIFLIRLALISSISFAKLSLSAGEVNMTCKIEYKTYKTALIRLWFQLDSNISSNMSNWEFRLDKCEPNFHNHFCDIWQRENTDTKLCKLLRDSNQVYCVKQINLHAEVRSTKPYHYRFYASNSLKRIVRKEIGRIRYLKCGCNNFDFEQKLKTTFPYATKADIRIGPFYNIPKLIDAKLDVAPNNVLNIKKYNDQHFEISCLNVCPTYNITVKLKTWPTCTNWKIKPSLLDFPMEGLTVKDIFCKFNQTHATLNTSADSSSQFYYNLTFMNKIFTKNVTKKITLPSSWIKNKPQNNLTASVKLCAHGCRKCGTNTSFICYSEITTDNGKEEFSKMTSPYLWLLFGIVFVVIFIAVIWANHTRKTRRYNKMGVKDTSYFSKEKLIKAEVHESLNSQQMDNYVVTCQN